MNAIQISDFRNSVLRIGWSLIRETFDEWNKDNAARLSAALAYYTVFSLAPLLIVVIAVAGLAFGREAASGQIFAQIQGLIGANGAKLIEDMVANASKPAEGILATVIGVVTLLLGASGVFGELQGSLNDIWNVKAKPQNGVMGFLRSRFFSFSMVLVTGFLLLVSLIFGAMSAAAARFVGGVSVVGEIINFILGVVMTTVLFALIFKYLPNVRLAWRDVWTGAFITSLLFNVGRLLIGLYLGQGSVASAYGAAGSLVIILLWVYYSAQILFFGAEFTQVFARRNGSRQHEGYLIDQNDSLANTQEPNPHRDPSAQPASKPAQIATGLGLMALFGVMIASAIKQQNQRSI